MRRLTIIFCFVQSLSFGQEDPFNCEEVFSYSKLQHIEDYYSTGYMLQSINDEEKSFTFLNSETNISIIVFFDESSHTIGFDYLMDSRSLYDYFIIEAKSCKSIKLVEENGDRIGFSFNGKKHDGIINFTPYETDEGTIYIIEIVKFEFESK